LQGSVVFVGTGASGGFVLVGMTGAVVGASEVGEARGAAWVSPACTVWAAWV
jgi:hypothetical protein